MESVVLHELHLNKTALEENVHDKGWVLSLVHSCITGLGSLLYHGLCTTLVPTWNTDQLTAVSTPSKFGSSSPPISFLS